jgi:hypothetical protein
MEERIIKTTCGHTFIVLDEIRKTLRPHSTSKPAAIYPDGSEEYYLNGILHTKENWESLVKQSKKLNKEN